MKYHTVRDVVCSARHQPSAGDLLQKRDVMSNRASGRTVQGCLGVQQFPWIPVFHTYATFPFASTAPRVWYGPYGDELGEFGVDDTAPTASWDSL